MVQINEQISAQHRLEPGLLDQSLARWASIRPLAPFLVEAETGRELSYAQTLAAVRTLRQKFGEQSRTILLMLPAGILNAVCWLSSLSGGHHLVPLSPAATEREKTMLARRYRPDIVLVEEEENWPANLDSLETRVLTRALCEQAIARPPLNDVPAAREGFVHLATSGSTGEPKGVMLSERQIAWNARQVHASHGLTADDRGFTALPFFHINAPVVSLCASLLAGSELVIARHFSRRQFWGWMERYRITWASLVPTIVAMLLDTEKAAFLPGSLRFMRTGSAALPSTHLRAFEERFGIPLIETYGLSEAASQVAANPVPPGRHKPGSAGLPTGVALRICIPRPDQEDTELHDVPPGETGEICLKGPGLITAYERNEGQDSFQDGWFRTGDLGSLDADGYLFIKGRLREVINRGGENIAPREIEEVLQSFPLVREAAAVPRPDPIYGEQVVAYLTVRAAWTQEHLRQLHAYLAQHLSTAKVPVDLIVLDELPRNATGKINRLLLRTREHARYSRNIYR